MTETGAGRAQLGQVVPRAGGHVTIATHDPTTNAATHYWSGGDNHSGWINPGQIASGVAIG
ncbi:hypothetical protein [Amycolatopsis saalfeldensis]|uniref:hypothetical protein n=1 Tax=Amycolatopsis saalfeldensis TaxID=394193 RepID=UPI0015A6AC6C|nr:hypothetical protein [Amycolatopsis saalfeldensis]